MPTRRDSDAIIAIVDDDLSVCEGLDTLIRSAGWRAESFASAQEFLARAAAEPPSCLILDLQLPGLSGLDLQKRLAEIGLEIPIVFLTGHGSIPTSVQAMKAGATEFLTKPVDEEDLLRAIHEAVERDQRFRKQNAEMRELQNRFESLTPREQEVLGAISRGLGTREIAEALSMSAKTVDSHRRNIREKLGLTSATDLVRYAVRWAGDSTASVDR